MKKRIAALVTAFLMLFACLTVKGTKAPVSVYAGNSSYQRQVAELVNHERIARGLKPLLYSRQLTEVAVQRAEELASMCSIQHVRPDGSSYDTIYSEYGLSLTSWAENTARYYKTPNTVMYGDGIGGNGWMNSSGHYSNMMGSYTFIGVGVATGSDGYLYWVQEFANGSLTGSYVLSDEDKAQFEGSSSTTTTTTKATTTTTKATTSTTTKKTATTTKATSATAKTSTSTTTTTVNTMQSTTTSSSAAGGTASTSPSNPENPDDGGETGQEDQLGFFARLWKIICDFFASLFGHGDNTVKAG